VKVASLLAVGFVVVLLVPATVHAQITPTAGPAALDGVVRELHLLRQAIERQCSQRLRAGVVRSIRNWSRRPPMRRGNS
jgi:hypothetical protein